MRSVTGLEVEYAALWVRDGVPVPAAHLPGVAFAGAEVIFNGVLLEHAEALAPSPGAGRSARVSDWFHVNGARIYLDTGEHPEYATPECATVDDVVAADLAGREILSGAARRATDELAAETDGAELVLLRNNRHLTSAVSWGCHENYQTSAAESKKYSALLARLASHVASRAVINGAGRVDDTGAFRLTQRGETVRNVTATTVSEVGALLHARHEPLADPRRSQRIQVVGGDSNMLPQAVRLTVATTERVVRTLERDIHALDDLLLVDPAAALRQADRWGLVGHRLADGRSVSVFDHQRMLAERVARTFDDQATTELAEEWTSIVDLLERDPDALVGVVDWVTKRWLLRRWADRNGYRWSSAQVRRAEQSYHDLRPHRSLLAPLQRRGMIPPACTPELVGQRARTAPPTRAQVRGEFIAGAHDRGLYPEADWGVVGLRIGDAVQRERLDDPTSCDDREACELLRTQQGSRLAYLP